MSTQTNGRGLSDQAKVALAVVAFGALSLVLVLLGNGSGVTGDLRFEATDAARTLVAEAVLSPPAPVRWEFFELGRRKPVHDLIFVEGELWIAADPGLLRLIDGGEFEPVAGFPPDGVPVRLWFVEDVLWAGLADGRAATLHDGAWQGPTEVALVFPPLFRVTADQLPDGVDLDAVCEALGMTATEDALWIACPESIVQVRGAELRRFTAVDGLPDTPTGPILAGPDGRIYVGLETGVAALEVFD
ncbi:MAG: hypothetical protein Kow0077_20390 [Anaerolineae bacterium]